MFKVGVKAPSRHRDVPHITRASPAAHSCQRSAQTASPPDLRTSVVVRLGRSSVTIRRKRGEGHKPLCHANLSISSYHAKKLRPPGIDPNLGKVRSAGLDQAGPGPEPWPANETEEIAGANRSHESQPETGAGHRGAGARAVPAGAANRNLGRAKSGQGEIGARPA
jgi:hypothetical protein